MKNFGFTLIYFLMFQISLFGQSLETPQGPLTPDKSLLNRTLELTPGHQIFRETYFEKNESKFIDLANHGQSPKILFIGCSDSRVPPELILHAQPGQLFVIRNAGNFVPTYNPS